MRNGLYSSRQRWSYRLYPTKHLVCAKAMEWRPGSGSSKWRCGCIFILMNHWPASWTMCWGFFKWLSTKFKGGPNLDIRESIVYWLLRRYFSPEGVDFGSSVRVRNLQMPYMFQAHPPYKIVKISAQGYDDLPVVARNSVYECDERKLVPSSI